MDIMEEWVIWDMATGAGTGMVMCGMTLGLILISMIIVLVGILVGITVIIMDIIPDSAIPDGEAVAFMLVVTTAMLISLLRVVVHRIMVG